MADVKAPVRSAVSPLVIVFVLAAVLAGIAFYWLSRPSPRAADQKPVLTAEARAYLPNLKLSEVQPQTSESYIQRSLFEVLGKITNSGNRTVRSVRVTCVFRNVSGVEIQREIATIVESRGGSLLPNATRSFRLAFDDLSNEWNQQMPDFVIAEIAFQ